LNELAAKSWAHALELLYATSWQPALHRYRSTLAYRGVSRIGRELSHGLSRLAGQPAVVEQHLLRNFRKYAEERPEARFDSTWHWLALAQHHGLPTRLLDWTYSPLVALHFVTAGAIGEDGVVWCVDYVRAKRQLPRRLTRALDDESCDVFTPELLAAAVASLDEFDRLADAPALVFLEPPALDQRIVAQYALFSLLTAPDAEMSDWMSAHAEMCCRIVIPATVKLEIRDKLDQANITERVLYPGLDGLSSWLRRYYQAR
jgi:hypothetical protein